ncbi:nucleotidyltransferase PLUS glutamate rich protein GrpB PLUS ribosomal protein alanine acetyltransferase [Legionella busanensis]|uniref:Nucleotidyltransferase PLUS glutamate rich protein GrpB PLUS ribosomal protein alanine acetyltransferase n=1 Tax=Legionella busanensis TaxID=190655 RepID=A0A378KB75_9GAMM|nr:GrpB family protein [Legionella busanensis]STX81590.1 nucleotidyltransferase PLUS glutamate rich protein GrpB PLUS ribosomal protein alanine acetyltransferase [Legionella busanensis]
MNNVGNIDEKVALVPFNPRWCKIYRSEVNRIKSNIELMHIEHIGSTSIPNIYAKPIVDIMIGLEDWENKESTCKNLINLDYEFFGEANVPGRIYFRKRNKNNFNIALCRYQSEIWINNILFRDYLIKHSEAAKAYSLLKKDILDSGGETLLIYSSRKASFIEETIKKAKQEQSLK